MVRTYKPKVNRKVTSPRKLQDAVNLVKAGWPIRKAAASKGVNRQTLFRAFKNSKNSDTVTISLSYKSRNVFPSELEKSIADYCIQVAQMGYGLTVKMCRELAYQVAQKNQLKMPANWETDKLAGIDWFHGFQKRHPHISIRIPEGCSIARAMAFNKTSVKIYFDKYSEVRERHDSFKDGSRTYNLDETSTSTVQNTRKILSPKGSKQVHQIKGAERGVSVTTCVIINAHGSLLPLVHIFSRKKFVPDLMINAFPGALGLGNEKGYMTKETFYHVMNHFIKCTASTKANPSLLMLDNVESHFSTQTLDLAKDNGVVVFTFPPHCTHKLQPLDVGFFGPFKTHYDNAVNTYLMNNPATPPTIYRIAGFVRDALSKAATPLNIIKSFEAPGIVPFNLKFTDTDFIMAAVTEKPDPSSEEQIPSEETAAEEEQIPLLTFESAAASAPVGENSFDAELPGSSHAGESTNSCFVCPADIRGFPKAKQTEGKRRKRRKGKCMIATDTPEKNEIMQREKDKKANEERKRQRQEKAVAGAAKKQKGVKKAKAGPKGKQAGVKKKASVNRVLDYESDDSEEAHGVSAEHPPPDPNYFPALPRSPEEEDYVLVSFPAAKETTHFVGKILAGEDTDGDLQISYLRKKVNVDKSVCFTLPPVPDLHSVHIRDVKVILPKPTTKAATRHQKCLIVFDYNFSLIKLG